MKTNKNKLLLVAVLALPLFASCSFFVNSNLYSLSSSSSTTTYRTSSQSSAAIGGNSSSSRGGTVTSSSQKTNATSSTSSSTKTTTVSSVAVTGYIACSYVSYASNSSWNYLEFNVRFYNGTNVRVTQLTKVAMKVYVDNVLEAEATFSTFSNSTSMAVGASLNWTLYFGSGSYNANFWPSLSGSHTFSLDYTINFDHA